MSRNYHTLLLMSSLFSASKKHCNVSKYFLCWFGMCDIILSMGKQFTSAQVAEKLGYTRSRVLQLCKILDMPRIGSQYVLSEKNVDTLKAALGHKPTGRPRKHTIDNKVMCVNDHISRCSVSDKEVVGQ